MSTPADTHRTTAAAFTATVRGAAPTAWDLPAPPEGWMARDVVRHLVEWFPAFLAGSVGITLPAGPSVDEDPTGAWRSFSEGVQAVLDDSERSAVTFQHPRAGTHRLDEAIAMFVLGDVLIHTWDLARATGLDETLDPGEVHGMRLGLEVLGDALVASGHYAPAVSVPDEADEQVRLLALTGRRA